jgi:hypothetical protein
MLLSFLGFDSDQAIAISSVYRVLAFEVFRGGYTMYYTIGSRYALRLRLALCVPGGGQYRGNLTWYDLFGFTALYSKAVARGFPLTAQ